MLGYPIAGAKRRPTTLDVFGEAEESASDPMKMEGANDGKTPNSAALFTEYRDTKPPYLKYSRDDLTRVEMPEMDGQSDACGSSSAGSTVRLSNDSS